MKGYIATCQNLGLGQRTFLPVFSFKQKTIIYHAEFSTGKYAKFH